MVNIANGELGRLYSRPRSRGEIGVLRIPSLHVYSTHSVLSDMFSYIYQWYTHTQNLQYIELVINWTILYMCIFVNTKKLQYNTLAK